MNIFKFFSTMIFVFGVIVFGWFGYQWYKQDQFKKAEQKEVVMITPQVPERPAVPEPPTNALKGLVTRLEGEVKLYPRVGKELVDLKNGSNVVQGETVWTKDDSSTTINFSDFAQITVEPESQIGLVSLLPDQFLVQHASGSASFLVKNKTLSVRTMRLLTEVQPGEATFTVNQDEGEITVKVSSGSAKLAIVDLDNNTNVYTVDAGEQASVNNAERTVDVDKQ